MALTGQFLGQLAHTLARPAQRRLWVSTRHRFHQPLQILAQAGILAHRGLTPPSCAPDPSFTKLSPLLQFLDPMADGLAGESCRS